MAAEELQGQEGQEQDDRLKAGVPGAGEAPPPEIEGEEAAEEKAQEEQELSQAADDAEREAIRARRREERHEKKERARQREDEQRRLISSLQRQNQEQAARLAALEQRNAGVDVAQIDYAYQQAANAAEGAKARIKTAVEANDGTALAEANDVLLLARQRMGELVRVKDQLMAAPQRNQQAIDPRVVAQAQSWMSKHKWYDPQSGDQDSRIALALDNALSAENWDPATPEYWEELDSRMRKYLPHRYQSNHTGNSAAASRGGQKAVVGGSGRDGGGSSAGEAGGFRLSPERVAAMKDAGIWDDPKAREKAINAYKTYDKEHSNVAR